MRDVTKKMLTSLKYAFLRLKIWRKITDEAYVKIRFFILNGHVMNLKEPRTFNEKLNWLKLHDRKPEYTIMVDKYLAKEYVAAKIGQEYVIPTIGVWDRFDDIAFDELPNQFVLKCTHDSGGLVICKNRITFDKDNAREKIEQSLRKNFFYTNREWPYKDVAPRIIAEKYMQDAGSPELRDYKFYCFNGEPKFLYISEGLANHETAKISFVNMDWTFAPFSRTDYTSFEQLPPKPEHFDDMIKIAKKLSEGIPFLRVDLYEIEGKVYFGELTFTPCGGMMPFNPPEADLMVGKYLNISGIK